MEKYRVYFTDEKGREFYIPCHTLAEAEKEKTDGICAGYTYGKTEDSTRKFLAMSGILLFLCIISLVVYTEALPLVLSLFFVGLVGSEILIRGGAADV